MGESKGNRKIVIGIIIVIICVVLALAVILSTMLMSTRSDGLTQDSSGETVVSKLDIDDSQEHASKLYENSVSDINDTTAVSELLDVMELEAAAGKYSVVISEEDGMQVLSLDLSEKIKRDDKKTFDGNMEMYAQQMLALIPGIDKVEWAYRIDSADKSEEKAVVSLDEKGASDILGKDVRNYGKSAEGIHKLLVLQKEL